MRVGDRTDFNRLRISIETDGTLSAREALERAIEIMITQLKAVIGFKEESEVAPEAPAALASDSGTPAAEDADEPSADIMKTRIEALNLSARTVGALTRANIRTVGGLARKKEDDLLDVEGLGPKAIQEVKRALSNFGITLK
jgi:DNA-directed RNA polymerase subunit alpha